MVDHVSIFLTFIDTAFYTDSICTHELNDQYFPKFCHFPLDFVLTFNTKLR